MTTLYITEYENICRDDSGLPAQIATEPAIANQTVSIGGTSAQSAAFNTETKFVRLYADVACCVSFGANPTSTNAKTALPVGSPEYFGVTPGHKVAVITV